MRGWRVKELLEGGVEGRLVFFDGEKVVSSMFHDEDSGGLRGQALIIDNQGILGAAEWRSAYAPCDSGVAGSSQLTYRK